VSERCFLCTCVCTRALACLCVQERERERKVCSCGEQVCPIFCKTLISRFILQILLCRNKSLDQSSTKTLLNEDTYTIHVALYVL